MLRLDGRDIEILKILQLEGRISKTDLARRINLSPTPCWDRLQRLEKAGVIESYGARVSSRALGPHVTVFVTVELEHHRAGLMQGFEAAVQRYPEITGVWALGGGLDYLMQIVTRDIDSYQRLIDTLLEARIGLARYYTHIVTKPVKSPGALPLDVLLGDAGG